MFSVKAGAKRTRESSTSSSSESGTGSDGNSKAVVPVEEKAVVTPVKPPPRKVCNLFWMFLP